MQVHLCSGRPILEPCSLQNYAHQLDSYVGCEHHCFYCYALNQAETDWAKEILVRPDFAHQLAQELAALEPQPIYIGWNSDAYQPAEQVYQHTRQALELLVRRGCSVCILTKSGLVTRDIDLIARMPGSSVGFSIAFQDDQVRQLFEDKAPPNECKIAALKKLKMAGIETYALITPVMPFITDVESLIELVKPYADTIWIYPLEMKSEKDRNWQNVRRILDHHFPELTEPYKQIAFSTTYGYWTGLRQRLQALQSETGLNCH
jgi:DNA repair photolyase